MYDTGNATVIDATARYNAGWTNCYNDVSLSKTGTLNLAGGVEYIVYPTGKQTPGGATQNMTGKALTIKTASDWNEALATVEINPSYVPTLSPGQTKTIEVRARLDKQSSGISTIRSITVQAAEISPAAARIAYNTSNGTVYATTSGSTTSYAVGLTASDATWDATNSRYNLPVSALLDTSITIKSRTFNLPTLTLDVTSSTTQVYLKEGKTTRLTANHVAAGWASYYDKTEWWGQAASQNSWYAKIPNRAGTGSENWNCGARTAYTTGAKTCYIGNAQATALSGDINLDFGEEYKVWPYGTDIDGKAVWNSGVTFKAPSPSPWLGRDDAGTEVTGNISMKYGESIDFYPAVTRGSGTIYWGPKRTVTAPGTTPTFSCATSATRGSSAWSGALNCGTVARTLIAKDSYINFQISASGTVRSCYIYCSG